MFNDISLFLGEKYLDINNWLIMNLLLSYYCKFDIFMLYESKYIKKFVLLVCVFIMLLFKILIINFEKVCCLR